MAAQEQSVLSPETVEEVSRLFKALADPTRIRILYLLSRGECSVTRVAEMLDLSQSAVSHQLSLLRTLRLVKYRREGHTFYFTPAMMIMSSICCSRPSGTSSTTRRAGGQWRRPFADAVGPFSTGIRHTFT